jgi:hypothetical protein
MTIPGMSAIRWIVVRLERTRPNFRRPGWRFRKYDVAPRLGLRAVERRLRQGLRLGEVSSETRV